MGLAYDSGMQRALWLLKLAAFDPGQLELMQQHWPGVTPDRMLELNRARALAAPTPEFAQAQRAARGMSPGFTPTPISGLGWQPGQVNPVSIERARFMDELVHGSRGAAPAPVASLAPYRANIPAAQPLTRQQMLQGFTQGVSPSQIVDVAPAASVASRTRLSQLIPAAAEGTAAAGPRALAHAAGGATEVGISGTMARILRRALGRKVGLG